MKKIIALIGPQDSGKTSSLNRFVEKIKEMKEARVFCIKKQINKKCKNGKKEYPESDRTYLIVINNLIIGVATAGDTYELIDKYTEQIIGCDIVFCAAHSEKTIKETLMHKEYGYRIDKKIRKEKGKEIIEDLLKVFNELI